MTGDLREEEYVLTKRGGAPVQADFCLTVTDDCMEPYIAKGQRVYVSCGAAPAEFDAGIFMYEGKVSCRQWCEDYAGAIHLLAANPARQDSNVCVPKARRESLVCLGRVLLDCALPRPAYE